MPVFLLLRRWLLLLLSASVRDRYVVICTCCSRFRWCNFPPSSSAASRFPGDARLRLARRVLACRETARLVGIASTADSATEYVNDRTDDSSNSGSVYLSIPPRIVNPPPISISVRTLPLDPSPPVATMSYYDNDGSWSAPVRQPSWEQPPPPSRSGTGSSMSQQHDPLAFASQFEEIDRATDNLMRSGKWFPGPMPAAGGMPIRRDSMPQRGGYEYGGADPRMGGGGGGSSGGPPSRHQSMSEYDGGRPGSAGLQGYYQGQRFPGGRQSEAEQMLQTKRRMAAQRERELRNYHQEQQYNRSKLIWREIVKGSSDC